MNLWLVRAGRHGEREQLCLDHGVVLLGWDDMPDLSKYSSREEMTLDYPKYFTSKNANSTGVNVGQLWRFAKDIKKGDLIAMPSKFQPVIHFGKVKEEYKFNAKNDVLKDMPHVVQVDWSKAVARSEFDQDLLYSFGSLLTVSQVARNNAVERVSELLTGKKLANQKNVKSDNIQEDIIAESTLDLAEHAQDEIIRHLETKFKGHDLTRLVDQILKAQGYVTTVSPPGPDGGIDILAGNGPLGFSDPKICVQVKSTEGQADVKIYRELVGVMSKVKADFGLLVSWSGFNNKLMSEAKGDFFKVRMWSANDIVEEIFKNYDKFSDEFKAELPLKKIWTLVKE
jgi:restriction system protein